MEKTLCSEFIFCYKLDFNQVFNSLMISEFWTPPLLCTPCQQFYQFARPALAPSIIHLEVKTHKPIQNNLQGPKTRQFHIILTLSKTNVCKCYGNCETVDFSQFKELSVYVSDSL